MTRTPLPSLVDEAEHPPAATGSAAAARKGDRRNSVMLVASIVVLIASGGIIYWQLFSGPPSVAAETRRRDLIDSKTGEVFLDFPIPANSRFPYAHPKTGEPTLFPAEKCFWTRDGKAKVQPTFVLLNEYSGKSGETLCPDCGRKVVSHNPMPPPRLLNEAAGGK